MPLREHADSGIPLVIADPDDPASQAIRQVARGLIAIAPAAPVLPVVQVGGPARVPNPASNGVGTPASEPKPVGMSLPMA
jgi:ATP-binding protein involved in chromosome partitioning